MCLLGSSGPWAGSTSVSSPVEWDAQGLHPWRAGTLRWCYICNPWACAATVLTLLILCLQQMLVWRKELQKCRKKREREKIWLSYLPFFLCSLLPPGESGLQYNLKPKQLLHNFIYLSMAVLSLCCCTGFSQVVNAEAGYSAVAVQRLLIVVASLVVEHGLSGRGARAQWLWSTGSVVVEHGLSGCGALAQWLWSTGSVAL